MVRGHGGCVNPPPSVSPTMSTRTCSYKYVHPFLPGLRSLNMYGLILYLVYVYVPSAGMDLTLSPRPSAG